MDNWIEFTPAGGWIDFALNNEVQKELHARLPVDEWHYQWDFLNFVIRETWESMRDSSTVVTHINTYQFEDGQVVRLAIKGDAALAIVHSLAV